MFQTFHWLLPWNGKADTDFTISKLSRQTQHHFCLYCLEILIHIRTTGWEIPPPPLPPPKKDTDLVRLPSIWFRFYDFIPDTTIGCYDVRDRSDPLPCTFTKKVTFLGSLYIVPHVTAWSAPLNGTIISTIWIAYTAAMFVLLILD